jgi:hypothetical protein
MSTKAAINMHLFIYFIYYYLSMRIFSQTGICRGFTLFSINLAGRLLYRELKAQAQSKELTRGPSRVSQHFRL